MKKILTLMLVCGMIFSAVSCTSADEDETESPSNDTEAETSDDTEAAETEPVLNIVDREMMGEPIEISLNIQDPEAYADITTDDVFTATWDLTAPEGERLTEHTGKPEAYYLDLSGNTLKMKEYMNAFYEKTDWTMYHLIEASVNQNYMEPWNPVGERTTEHAANDYMTASVTTANGETIMLNVVWVISRAGNGERGFEFEFDRTITDEAVTFSVDFHLPEATESETTVE